MFLPFNTTWQGLKDYIKPVCTVDHVEIFPKSTSGWVRVNGYKNFRAAFDHLNGKEFNGRAIIADDRNADKPLKGSRSYTMSMSPSSYMATPDTVYSQTVMPSWNTLASQPDPMSAYGYGSATQSYYNYPTVPDRQPALYDHSASYAVQPAQPYGEYSEYYAPPTTMSLTSQFANLAVGTGSTGAGGGGGHGGGVVYTEQRGIHIRDLSRRASEDQVRKMIREAAGREADLINGVEVPLDKDRNLRGWALVHFRSADLARRMVGVLNGVEFKGKRLEVRLLKEGETVGGGSSSSSGGGGVVAGPSSSSSSSRGHRSGKHGDRRDEGGRRREKDRGERSSASSKSSPPSSSKSGPLVVGSGTMIAEASSSRDKGKGKGKEKEKDKHGGSGSSSGSSKFSVVIADGSLGRRRSISDKRGS
ncbi:hypothetical protein VMCG_00420 [Cytospora schulzeri]|uniref:RRM domain-containing protein n=1 Tax=Cytospora schulzeri TaxID=448051 RepID=A0A423X8L8_9PEZI|nr:hypothetical protein VMCG_00420 [Valsa malicola]